MDNKNSKDNSIKYNKDIILQLIKLKVANIDEIINAMDNVINKNDINEITDYIIKNRQKKSNQTNTNSSEIHDIFSALLSIVGEENRKYIIDAINNVQNKNDIDEICYYLINQSKPPSMGYALLYLHISLFFLFNAHK